ncbi:MAG: aminopeptidase [Deltaproteobacteria bacterium]|nr:aminopeptidase [Deltaproteobacteria bacterium]
MNTKEDDHMSVKEFETRSCWDVYASEADCLAMDELADRYMDFLSVNKTEREVVTWAVAMLEKAGFISDPGTGRFLTVHRGKTLVAARRGRRPLSRGSRMVGSHADSPRLDLKQHPLYEDCDLALAKTHYYGGIRKYQWLARPLALHGVAVKTDGRVVPVVVGEDERDPVLAIPDLLPHLAHKQVEKKLSEAFEAEKLNVVLGHVPLFLEGEDKKDGRFKKALLELLRDRFGLEEEDLFSAELEIVPAGPARRVGLDRGLVGGYGQDDRICGFTSLEAFVRASDPEFTQILILWDKEEIGSEGATGAQSRIFEYAIQDLIEAWEPRASLRQVMLNMKALSGDVHAAIDQDYQDLHDKLNASYLGRGPVICKFTGHRGKYGANDASAEYVGWFRNVLNVAGVPWQMAELGKVDLGGGGTVAKHLAVYGMDIVDFGPGVLSMHSPFEISSVADLLATVRAYGAFFRS